MRTQKTRQARVEQQKEKNLQKKIHSPSKRAPCHPWRSFGWGIFFFISIIERGKFEFFSASLLPFSAPSLPSLRTLVCRQRQTARVL